MARLSTNSGLYATVKSGLTFAYSELMEYKGFAQRLKGLMNDKDIKNQKQLAEWLGVSTSIVSEWLRAEKIPSHETAIMITNKFSCSLDWLMTGKGSKTPDKKTIDPFYAMYLELPEKHRLAVQNLVKALSETQEPKKTLLTTVREGGLTLAHEPDSETYERMANKK